MLCIADRHCSQRCIAMPEMLLCGLCVKASLSYAVHAVIPEAHCM